MVKERPVGNEASASLVIQGLYPSLRKSEQLAAEYILADISRFIGQSVQSAARSIGVSEASLMRFAQRLGYSGFRELKLRLAEEVGRMSRQATGSADLSLSPGEDLSSISRKIISRTIRSLENTLEMVDVRELERAVNALRRASRIDIYGVSNSASIGMDAMNKLIRLGIRCQVFSDAHQQIMAAITLSPKDVAIGISHTGRTRETVDALKRAHDAGATTICIANYRASEITRFADIKLLTASFEASFPSDTMVSRISQLAIVDILFTGVLVMGYAKYKGLLSQVEEALKSKLY